MTPIQEDMHKGHMDKAKRGVGLKVGGGDG